MHQGHHRVSEKHPRAGVAHDGADAMPHRGIEAVDRASRARRLVGQEFARVQASERIVQHVSTIYADFSARAVYVPTVDLDHALDRALFANKTTP
jgi:hypothetical protein